MTSQEYRGKEEGKERVIIISVDQSGKTIAEKTVHGNNKEEAIEKAIFKAGEDKGENQDFTCMEDHYPGFIWIEEKKEKKELTEKELFERKNYTPEFKEAILHKSDHKNNQSSDRVSDYINKIAEGIFKIVWYAYNRDQYLIWDFNQNKQADLRKKEYNHLKNIKGEYTHYTVRP